MHDMKYLDLFTELLQKYLNSYPIRYISYPHKHIRARWSGSACIKIACPSHEFGYGFRGSLVGNSDFPPFNTPILATIIELHCSPII